MRPRTTTSDRCHRQSARISDEHHPLHVPDLFASQSGQTFEPRTILPPLSETLNRIFSPPTPPISQRERNRESLSTDSFSTSPVDLWRISRDEPRRVDSNPYTGSPNRQLPTLLTPSKHFRTLHSEETSSTMATGPGNPVSGRLGWSTDTLHIDSYSTSPSSRPSAFSPNHPSRTVSPLRPHTSPYVRPIVESMEANRALSLSPMLARLPPLGSINFPSTPGTSRTRSSQEQWSSHPLPRIRSYSRTRAAPRDYNTYSTSGQEKLTCFGHSPSSHFTYHPSPADPSAQPSTVIPQTYSPARQLRSHTLSYGGSPVYRSGHHPLSGSLPTYSSHLEVLGSSTSRQAPTSPMVSTSVFQQPATTTQTGPPQKEFSFISIPGINTKKRPRRRYEEIERLYSCNWPECDKSYGTLNHLNAHIVMQKHGPKRHPSEFKHIQKGARKRVSKDEQNDENLSETASDHSPTKALSVSKEVSSPIKTSEGEAQDSSRLSQSGKGGIPLRDILQEDDPQNHPAITRSPSPSDQDK